MKGDKIYCLFSQTDDYGSSHNNLEAWWHEKPSLDVLAKSLGHSFPSPSDEVTLSIVKIWGMEVEQRINHAEYRLDLITPGRL